MFEKVLIPIDSITFDNTLQAVKESIGLASGHNNLELIFMHVWNTQKSGVSKNVEDRMKNVRKKQIEREFEEIKKICEEEGLENYRTLFKEGGAADKEIVKTAMDENVDLIIMGSGKIQDRSFSGRIKKFAYGSITEKVMHESPCSIMVSFPQRRES